MTKRDYVIISRVLRKAAQTFDNDTAVTILAQLRSEFIRELEQDNRNFDRDLFNEACDP